MLFAAPGRRWLLAAIALLLFSGVYLMSYHGDSLQLPNYAQHNPVSDDVAFQRNPKQQELGYAWYDYIENPPTSSVSVEIPEAVTRASASASLPVDDSVPTLYLESNHWEAYVPSAKPFEAPQYVLGNPTLEETEYSRMLVVTKKENDVTDWVVEAMKQDSLIGSVIYSIDDPNDRHYVTQGRAMVPLQYIVDNYDELRDITMFVNGATVQPELDTILNGSVATVLKNMDRKKIITEGFFNLRCKQDPGCPKGIPLSPQNDLSDMQELAIMNGVWQEFFGEQNPPKRLAQPGFGQYAVSRDRIRALPKEKYEYFLARLAASSYSPQDLDKFWSYTWQWVWTGAQSRCPNEVDCLCVGYKICFEDSRDLGAYESTGTEIKTLKADAIRLLKPGDSEKDKERKAKLEKVQQLIEENGRRIAEAMARGAEGPKDYPSPSSQAPDAIETPTPEATSESNADSIAENVPVDDTTDEEPKGLWDAIKEMAAQNN